MKHCATCGGGVQRLALNPHHAFTLCKGNAHFRIVGRPQHYAVPAESPMALFHIPSPPTPLARETKWTMPDPGPGTAWNALNHRVARCVLTPDRRAIMDELVPHMLVLAKWTGHHGKVPFAAVYANYPAKKKRAYMLAEAALLTLGGHCTEAHAMITMFVKLELYKVDPSKIPDARAIQFRTKEYTLELASYLKGAEEAMYKLSDVPGFGYGHHFAKNLNMEQRGDALKALDDDVAGYWVCLDISRFDSSVSLAMKQLIEIPFFRATCDDDVDLRELLQWQCNNRGTYRQGDDTIRYQVRGGRMSGDANTAFGNCVIVSTCLARLGEIVGGKFGFVDDGDDSVFKSTKYVPDDLIIGAFARWGFQVKIECRPTRLEEVEFCQSRPVEMSRGKYKMVRNPVRVITRSLASVKLREPKERVTFMRTVALGELSLNPGVPVLQAFFKRMIEECDKQLSPRQRKRGGLNKAAISDSYRRAALLPKDWTKGRTKPVSQLTRRSFDAAWGFQIQHQLVEEKIMGAWSMPLLSTVRGQGPTLEDWEFPWYRPEDA